MEPAFQAVADVARTVWALLTEGATTAYNGIMSATGQTSSSLMENFMIFTGVAEYAFKNMGTLGLLGFTKVRLYATTAFETIKHFFTGVMPALAGGFATYWGDAFYNAANFVFTIFKNLAANLKAIWSGVLSFISGNGFQVDFVPLTKGFERSVRALPDIPERAMTELEKSLSADISNLTADVNAGVSEAVEKNLNRLNAFRNKVEEQPLDVTAEKKEEEAQETRSSSSKTKDVGVMQRGSQEALKTILGARENKQLAQQIKQTKAIEKGNNLLGKIAEKSSGGMGFKIQPGV